MAEKSVTLEKLRPGAYVAQPAKEVCRTAWTAEQITVHFTDGTSYTGAYSDAVTVIRTAAQEHADTEEP